VNGRISIDTPQYIQKLELIESASRAAGKYVGICGQGPSDHPDFAAWLADEGIESISLNPDSVIATWNLLAQRDHGGPSA